MKCEIIRNEETRMEQTFIALNEKALGKHDVTKQSPNLL